MFLSEYYPPGLEPPGDALPLDPVGGLAYARRALTGEFLRGLATRLNSRSPALRRQPTAGVIASLGRVHRAWSEPQSPLRAEAVDLLRRGSGYPSPILD